MIDLEAQGPVYRGHKLSRIVDEYHGGYMGALAGATWNHDKPVSTRAWARLDVRVFGNVWGLSALDAK